MVGSAVPQRESALVYSLPVDRRRAVRLSFVPHKLTDVHISARGPSLPFTVLQNVERYNHDPSYVNRIIASNA